MKKAKSIIVCKDWHVVFSRVAGHNTRIRSTVLFSIMTLENSLLPVPTSSPCQHLLERLKGRLWISSIEALTNSQLWSPWVSKTSSREPGLESRETQDETHQSFPSQHLAGDSTASLKSTHNSTWGRQNWLFFRLLFHLFIHSHSVPIPFLKK